MAIAPIRKKYNGVLVSVNPAEGMANLTQMWRADGSPENKEPWIWVRGGHGIEFVEALKLGLKPDSESGLELIKTARGRYGGTWAHWQIGMAYAQYLIPKFHICKLFTIGKVGKILLVSGNPEARISYPIARRSLRTTSSAS